MAGSLEDVGDLAVSLWGILENTQPSISFGGIATKGRYMMEYGSLFSSQICLKVAAMPSAFPMPATTHWRAGCLPPARPALWTGTAPPRYWPPGSPTLTDYPLHLILPSAQEGTAPPHRDCGTSTLRVTLASMGRENTLNHVTGKEYVVWRQQALSHATTSYCPLTGTCVHLVYR